MAPQVLSPISASLTVLALCLTYFSFKLYLARRLIWEKNDKGLVGSPKNVCAVVRRFDC